MLKSRRTETVRRSGTAKRTVRSKKNNRPTFEDVSRKAYELYEQRDHTHGHDQDDWLTAERILSKSNKR